MQPPDVGRIVTTVSNWPGIHAAHFQHGGMDFLLGPREIGHVHGSELVDIPFPRPVRDELVAAGRARPHHLLAQSGWVTVLLNSPNDVDQAIELLKLSYEMATENQTGGEKILKEI